MKINIIAKTPHFIVVDKPSGLNFHCEEGIGLVEIVRQQLVLACLFPVHRLDKMTSGLVLFALDKNTATQFMRLFENHQIEKYYLAISTEKPKKKQGWVKGGMEKARRGSWKLNQSNDNYAKTRFISQAIQPNERLFLLKPYTGKTHQLRVALKSISAPIAGDERYQPLADAKKEDRGYLHAYALKFKLNGRTYSWVYLPNNGKRFSSTAFKLALENWQQPWSMFNG